MQSSSLEPYVAVGADDHWGFGSNVVFGSRSTRSQAQAGLPGVGLMEKETIGVVEHQLTEHLDRDGVRPFGNRWWSSPSP